MKKLVIICILLLTFFSCKKDHEDDFYKFLIPENEVPVWMKTKIEQKEQIKLWLGAWVRYEWQNESYFEVIDLTSSSFPVPVSFTGDPLFTNSQDGFNSDVYKSYSKEKCCKTFVWKSPEYLKVFGTKED